MFIKSQMVVSPPEIFTKSGLGRPLSANLENIFGGCSQLSVSGGKDVFISMSRIFIKVRIESKIKIIVWISFGVNCYYAIFFFFSGVSKRVLLHTVGVLL